MKEHGLIMSAPMVRAIAEGRKTVTRRTGDRYRNWKVGDRIWIRETWADTNGEAGPMISYRAFGDKFLMDCPEFLCEDGSLDYSKFPKLKFTQWCGDLRRGEPDHVWTPSIHMPRWASRFTLEIVDIRKEPLHRVYVSGSEPFKEGVEVFWDDQRDGYVVNGLLCDTALSAFRDLWDLIKGKGSFDQNPDVWRIEFKELPA